MGESVRETGRRRARLAAVAVGATGVFGVGAVAAAVYVPAAVQNVTTNGGAGSSDDSGQNGGSDGSQSGVSGQDDGGTTNSPLNNGSTRHSRYQQSQPGQQGGLAPSQGGGPMGQSSGS